ncbi:MAG: tripartite tricarboxylate transporter substrate binding protein [Betaproteobacteria bacterium]|nr:tripartite tricarboxylate transporter substrate binding protein [Betaproteobacteria bacterium]
MIRATTFAALAASVHLTFAGVAAAQAEYPVRPIRLLVPQTTGSSTDTVSRVLFPKMGELLGQQIVIDNRTGAGGIIASGIVAHAEPDGYTLLCGATPSQVIGPQLYPKSLTYDNTKAFAAIGKFAVTNNVLIANLKTPFTSVKDLIAHARDNPGKLNWGNAGAGFQSHLASVLFTHLAKIDVLHVSYKGAGPMVTGVISGESQVTLGPAPAWMVHVQAGRARALAMAGAKRSVLWPELPTIVESGLPGFVSDGWIGLMAPRGISKPVHNKLYGALVKAMDDPATVERLKRAGAEPSVAPSAEFTALIASDWKSFGEAIKIAGLKPQ